MPKRSRDDEDEDWLPEAPSPKRTWQSNGLSRLVARSHRRRQSKRSRRQQVATSLLATMTLSPKHEHSAHSISPEAPPADNEDGGEAPLGVSMSLKEEFADELMLDAETTETDSDEGPQTPRSRAKTQGRVKQFRKQAREKSTLRWHASCGLKKKTN